MNNDVKCAASLLPINLVGHDVIEVVTGDESIIIEVGFVEYVVPFVVTHVFTELLTDLLQLQSGDFSLHKLKHTALLISNEDQTLSISALLSFSPNLAVASLKNSGNSIPPD